METIGQLCERLGISRPIYYKLAHKLGRRPTEVEIKKHIKSRKNGRPRQEKF